MDTSRCSLLGSILLWLVTATTAAAEDWRDQLLAGGTATVTAIIDGDTVRLDDGREVRLVGIQAPKLPLGRPDFTPWPLADDAKTALEALVQGRVVALWYGDTRQDRHGRLLAHLARVEGDVWVQRRLLRQGLARVYSFADNRALVPRLLTAEAAARQRIRGIWRDAFYHVRVPADLEAAAEVYAGTFQIVRGRVWNTGEGRTKLYVNFGGRWRTDFTVEVPASVRRRFDGDARLRPARLAGALIEVRGWIELVNGPMIAISHPEQIVFLEIATTKGHDHPISASPDSQGGTVP